MIQLFLIGKHTIFSLEINTCKSVLLCSVLSKNHLNPTKSNNIDVTMSLILYKFINSKSVNSIEWLMLLKKFIQKTPRQPIYLDEVLP